MPTTLHENRPSAGIGLVEVQKPIVFCDFCGARATLCGDRRGRGAKTYFLRFLRCSHDPLRGSAWSRCKKPVVFCDFCGARATLCRDRRGRGAKTHGLLAISAVLARPSAGIGVVEVQKTHGFCDFCGARATLCGDRCGRGAKTHGFFAISAVPAQPSAGIGVVEVQKPMVFFATFCCSNWSSGVVSWFARLLPEPAGRGFDSSLVRGRRRKMQLAF